MRLCMYILIPSWNSFSFFPRWGLFLVIHGLSLYDYVFSCRFFSSSPWSSFGTRTILLFYSYPDAMWNCNLRIWSLLTLMWVVSELWWLAKQCLLWLQPCWLLLPASLTHSHIQNHRPMLRILCGDGKSNTQLASWIRRSNSQKTSTNVLDFATLELQFQETEL